MLGAIIGDIVGSRFEFNNHRSKEFDLFAPECNYTDDTICNAISIGGDSDTIACIASGIAEALHGIPQNLQSIAISYLPPDMKKVLDADYCQELSKPLPNLRAERK